MTPLQTELKREGERCESSAHPLHGLNIRKLARSLQGLVHLVDEPRLHLLARVHDPWPPGLRSLLPAEEAVRVQGPDLAGQPDHHVDVSVPQPHEYLEGRVVDGPQPQLPGDLDLPRPPRAAGVAAAEPPDLQAPAVAAVEPPVFPPPPVSLQASVEWLCQKIHERAKERERELVIRGSSRGSQ